MASFSVNVFGYTKTGTGMRELLKTAKESDLIDGIGFNCGIGPSHLGKLLKRQDLGELIVAAVPNAGICGPDREPDGVYRDNSGYFSEAMEEIAGQGGQHHRRDAAGRTRDISGNFLRQQAAGPACKKAFRPAGAAGGVGDPL